MNEVITVNGDSSAARLMEVQRRIAAACGRCGRDPETVQLLAVSKTVAPEAVRALYDCGQRIFGESRIQEAVQKIPLCPGDIQWHMIGHLQTNKVAAAVRGFSVFHSLDSLRVIQALGSAAEIAGSRVQAYLQVNVSGESAKYGMAPADLPEALEVLSEIYSIEVAGLMTIPPFAPDPEAARPHFRALRELRDRTEAACNCSLPGLSMGMTHDLEVAVEEGATCVRVGSALFGERR